MTVRIVGRESELERLQEFLRADRPIGALVISGGPGIGKTTLWEAGVMAARERGVLVLSARPGSAETQFSFAALRDLLDAIHTATLQDVPVPQRRALEVALVRDEPNGAPPESPAIGLGLLNALRSLARGERLLVAIDDVQWLDPPSAGALAFAARRLDGDAIGFLLARRAGSPSVLEQALERTGIERVEVGPLTLGATRRLLYQRLGLILPRRDLRRIFDAAQGNPLFALELGRTVAEREPPEIGDELPVPEAIEDLLGTRVASLPDTTRKLLLAVALGGDMRMSQVKGIADPDAVDDAVTAGALVVEGDRVRASHPLLAAAVRRNAGARERRRVHAALARAFLDVEPRARHLALASPHPDAELAATLAAAAASAGARGAAEEAAELAEHALRLTPPDAPERAERVLALAERLWIAGHAERLEKLLEAELDSLPAGVLRGRAHLLLADGRAEWSAEEYERGLELAFAQSEGEPALRAAVLTRKAEAVAVGYVERIEEADRWATEALAAANAAGPEEKSEALHVLAWTRMLRGGAIDDLSERFSTLSDAPFLLFRSVERVAAIRLACRGEIEHARAAFTRLLTLADERGEAWSHAAMTLHLCELELRAGESAAVAPLLDAWDHSPDGVQAVAPGYQRCRALLAAARGRADEAARAAEDTIAAVEKTRMRWDLLEALRAQGIAAVLAHEPERAVESLRAVWEHTEREGVADPGVFPVAPDLVEALVALGEHGEAMAVTDRLRGLAERQRHPWGLATATRCDALVRLASRSYDEEAATAVEQAATAYEQLGLRFDSPRSLLALGRAQRRFKKWAAARQSLERAAAAFDEIGSHGWADEARSELARVGGRRRGAAGELTPAEQRVVELAIDGLSNKEIAQQLFVVVNTVEVHLSHAYAKLGVHSRSQLGRARSAKA